MSGLIILLCIVLFIMLLPRLLMWWLIRRRQRFQEKMNDMFGGSYQQHRDQATSTATRHTYNPAATAEDAEFETINSSSPNNSEHSDTSDLPDPSDYTDPPIVDAEFEQIQ